MIMCIVTTWLIVIFSLMVKCLFESSYGMQASLHQTEFYQHSRLSPFAIIEMSKSFSKCDFNIFLTLSNCWVHWINISTYFFFHSVVFFFLHILIRCLFLCSFYLSIWMIFLDWLANALSFSFNQHQQNNFLLINRQSQQHTTW